MMAAAGAEAQRVAGSVGLTSPMGGGDPSAEKWYRTGVVRRHCIASAMLCDTTSQLGRAQSTVDRNRRGRIGEAASIEY
jgi:hypothetical protein